MTPTSPPSLFGPAFDADPDATFTQLRDIGPVTRAEISPGVYAWLVTSHAAATDLLNHNVGSWTRDTRRWTDFAEGRVPPDSPVLGILAWREGLLHSDGIAHRRLAEPLREAMDQVAHHHLEVVTRSVANIVLDGLVPTGRFDLVGDYATNLPLLVFAELLGCTRQASARMVEGCALIVSGGPASAAGADMFVAELAAVVAEKTANPGADIASRMLAHPNKLSPQEVTGNLFSLTGAGNVPTAAWICMAAVDLLRQTRLNVGRFSAGAVPDRDARRRVLWQRAPVGTFTFLVALEDTPLHGADIVAGDLVLVSHHAVNTDPAVNAGLDSRAHMAFSAGEHRCPFPSHAAVIARTALNTLFDRVPDARLGEVGPLSPGIFHQCVTHAIVTFTPRHPRQGGTP